MRYMNIFTISILFNIWAYILIKLRATIYKNKVFKPMIWNMKLSIIPIAILFIGTILSFIFLIIASYNNVSAFAVIGYLVFILTVICWLLFLPNSAYLITELNLTHRSMDRHDVPIWYDIISILSLSLSGIFNTILGITTIQLYYLVYFDPESITNNNKFFLNISALIIIILVTIGIYLGRQVRFNSWDILNPLKFIKKMKEHFKKDKEYINFFLFILVHSVFLTLMYYSFAPLFS